MPERTHAVVIGAGLGGLAAAVTLAGEGLDVTVLEAQSHPGGGYDELYRSLGILDRLRLHRLDPVYRPSAGCRTSCCLPRPATTTRCSMPPCAGTGIRRV